jgi:hypothetical protein
MAATAFFPDAPLAVPAQQINTPTRCGAIAFNHHHHPVQQALTALGKEMLPPVMTRTPASKKVKLSTPPAEAVPDLANTGADIQMGGTGAVDDKGIQTTPAAAVAAESARNGSQSQKSSPGTPLSLTLHSLPRTHGASR